MRKLFTYLVFQFDAFSSGDVEALRNALANRRLYFGDFVLGWDRLYTRPLKEVVGPDHDCLRSDLEEAIECRNKIFHGQLTTRYLSRAELIGFAAQIRCWCRALAAGSQREVGYDGFGRNSFRKSDPPLKDRLATKINSVQDYNQLLAAMEKQPKGRFRSRPGS
jgi:hypothetical protein